MTGSREAKGRTSSIQRMASELSVPMFDSWAIQAEMLAHGLTTLRLPKEALLSVDSTGETRLAFMGGESLGTSLAAESFSRNPLSWRSLLRSQRFPVGPASTFSRNQAKSICKFADSVGYPVALSRVVTGRPRRMTLATSSRELRAALDTLMRSTRSSIVAVEGYRTPTYLDCLVIGPSVVSVIETSVANYPREAERSEVLDTTHPTILHLAASAASSMPGLDQASICLSVDDRAVNIKRQHVAIIDIDVAPRLRARSSGPRFVDLAGRILAYRASEAALSLDPRKDTRTSTFALDGCPQEPEWRTSTMNYAGTLGLESTFDGDLGGGSQPRFIVSGEPAAQALLAVELISGGTIGGAAHLVETRPS